MSIRTIPRGAHRPNGWMWRVGLTTKKRMRRTVTFLPSSRYVLQGDDAKDWNKLFGWGSVWGVHRRSYRFGWRVGKNGEIELSAYWYWYGQRQERLIASAWVMEKVELEIAYDGDGVVWNVNGVKVFAVTGDWDAIGLRLGLYFGGNNAAPSDIKVIIESK